jgi:hypothetical protein
MKILFLILASDGGVYTELQKVWRTYIHSYPGQIEAYFYKADPKLATDYRLEGDVLTVKCPEGLTFVARKLKLALKAFEGRLDEFDYICRPNLSSFFIVPRYLAALESLPKTLACMAKEHLRPAVFPTGAGFTITPDIAKAILVHPFPQHVHGGDDVAVGAVLKELGVKIRDVQRVDITAEAHREARLRLVAEAPTTFHVRVKHEAQDRLQKDLVVHERLLQIYYGLTLQPSESPAPSILE